MSETDERFLARLSEEAERLLGPGNRLEHFELAETGDGVQLTATLATPGGVHVVAATGGSIVDAAGELMKRLPEERLALAFRRLVEEEGFRSAGA
jgi:hypothetical protein